MKSKKRTIFMEGSSGQDRRAIFFFTWGVFAKDGRLALPLKAKDGQKGNSYFSADRKSRSHFFKKQSSSFPTATFWPIISFGREEHFLGARKGPKEEKEEARKEVGGREGNQTFSRYFAVVLAWRHRFGYMPTSSFLSFAIQSAHDNISLNSVVQPCITIVQCTIAGTLYINFSGAKSWSMTSKPISAILGGWDFWEAAHSQPSFWENS